MLISTAVTIYRAAGVVAVVNLYNWRESVVCRANGTWKQLLGATRTVPMGWKWRYSGMARQAFDASVVAAPFLT